MFAFVEAARRRVVVLPSRVEHLETHRSRLAGRVAEVVRIITVRIVLKAIPILEFAGRNRVRGRRDDVANIEAIFKAGAEAIGTFGDARANPGDATASVEARGETGGATAEAETVDDDAFAFVANVSRLNLRSRLRRNRRGGFLSVGVRRNEGKRGGEQQTRENVAFHFFLLKIKGPPRLETAAIRKTRRSRRRDDVKGGRNVVAFRRDAGVFKNA